jgi:hypothetical protein
VRYVGVDLHKKTIGLCVVDQERQRLDQRRFLCAMPEPIVSYFRKLTEIVLVNLVIPQRGE